MSVEGGGGWALAEVWAAQVAQVRAARVRVEAISARVVPWYGSSMNILRLKGLGAWGLNRGNEAGIMCGLLSWPMPVRRRALTISTCGLPASEHSVRPRGLSP